MEVINSFWDTVKERTTNPFFGTLIGVWIIRNWILLYTIFNFDSGSNLEIKRKYISDYFASQNTIQELGINVGLSIVLLIFGYVLMIFTRVIINVANHRITPYLNSKTVSKLVVNKNRFETVKKQRDDFFSLLEDAQESIINLEQRNSLLRNENAEMETLKIENSNNLNKLATAEHEIIENAEELRKTIKDLTKNNMERTTLGNNIQKLTSDVAILEEILYKDFVGYEDMNRDQQKILEQRIPSMLTKTYENFKNLSLHIQFFKIAEYVESEIDIHPDVRIDEDKIRSLIAMELITQNNTTKGYTLDNLILTEFGKIIYKFSSALDSVWADKYLPF